MTPFNFVFGKPFAYQVAAFRLRLRDLVPTSTWEDMRGAEHDRGFMVAGALKADLLADLAAAVDKAVSQGTSLEQFRRDFRTIVEQRGWHGWTGEGTKGGEAWRTRVIYRTNLATSYAAGRMAQLRAEGFPLWVYRHGASLEPREEHLSWDGLILEPDHPFWATHAPPNGWGCSCYIVGAHSREGARRVGGKPDLTLPDGWEAINPKTGVQVGLDKGWDHAPGATVTKVVAELVQKAPSWPYGLAKAFMASMPSKTHDQMAMTYRLLPSTAKAVESYVRSVPAEGSLEGVAPYFTMGMVTRPTIAQIDKLLGVDTTGFDYALEAPYVRHILTRHTSAKVEASRGQVPVEPRHYTELLLALNDPDQVETGEVNQGSPTIVISKRIGTEIVHAIFMVKTGRKRLQLLTMWIENAG